MYRKKVLTAIIASAAFLTAAMPLTAFAEGEIRTGGYIPYIEYEWTVFNNSPIGIPGQCAHGGGMTTSIKDFDLPDRPNDNYSGMDFDGWYLDSDMSIPADLNDPGDPPYHFYAQYVAPEGYVPNRPAMIRYTWFVTGLSPEGPMYGVGGEAFCTGIEYISLPEDPGIGREGAVFDGWYSDSRCTIPADISKMDINNLHFYGQYVPDQDHRIYTYRYVDENGNPITGPVYPPTTHAAAGLGKINEKVTLPVIELKGYTYISGMEQVVTSAENNVFDIVYRKNSEATASDADRATQSSAEKHTGSNADKATGSDAILLDEDGNLADGIIYDDLDRAASYMDHISRRWSGHDDDDDESSSEDTPLIIKGCWELLDDGNWRFSANGHQYRNEWVYAEWLGNAYWFRFDNDANMQTGWISENGIWYYLNPISDGTKGIWMPGKQK